MGAGPAPETHPPEEPAIDAVDRRPHAVAGLRTAAVSAIAAKHGAAPGATTLALAGCGFEGTMHVRFITHVLPSIERVRLRDIRPEAMARLEREARGYFPGEILSCADNESCLAGAHVIATCTNGDDQLVAGTKPGRESAAERIIAVPIGMAICDVALAHLAYNRAVERGVGQRFRLL